MRKCIITGAGGFVGSNLTRTLLQQDYEVNVIVKEGMGLGLIEDIKEQVNVFAYDGNIAALIDFCKSLGKLDVVFHLASLVLTNHTVQDIDELISSNIAFGTHLLEAMELCECNKMINTSTYWQHYNQEEYNPVNLYAATKEAFEKILEYYARVKNISAITLEIFDNYGPGDPRPKLMNLLKRCYYNDEILKMTPGEQLIDLLYIDDLIEGYIAADKMILEANSCSKYMLTAGQRVTLKQLVSKFEAVTNKKLDITFGGMPYKEREVMIPWDKGVILPNWSKKVDLEEGIKRFIDAKM